MKKTALLLTALLLFVGCEMSATEDVAKDNTSDSAQKIVEKSPICEEEYGIFGNCEWETEVTGYLVSEEQEVFGQMQETAYFKITEFGDDGLRESIQAGIDEGNSVNAIVDGEYALGMGCLEEEGLYAPGVVMDDTTKTAVEASTAEAPTTIKLEFGIHSGKGCDCCTIVHGVKLMN